MIVEAINGIIQIAKPETVQIEGKHYSDRNMFRVDKDQLPTAIKIKTLTGLRDFVISGRDCDPGDIFIHVVDFNHVLLISSLTERGNRKIYIEAEHVGITHKFGKWLPVDEFIIWLRSGFMQNDSRDVILAYVSAMTAESSTHLKDDGIFQSTSIKRGIRIEVASVPNQVLLQPYRTFNEIGQPSSKFVFRIQSSPDGKPACSLFEADGGEWKNRAMEKIKSYLIEQLPDIDVIA